MKSYVKNSFMGVLWMTSTVLSAQSYSYNSASKCEIREFAGMRMKRVDPSKLDLTKIYARHLEQDRSVMAFKKNNRVFLTKDYCLTEVEDSTASFSHLYEEGNSFDDESFYGDDWNAVYPENKHLISLEYSVHKMGGESAPYLDFFTSEDFDGLTMTPLSSESGPYKVRLSFATTYLRKIKNGRFLLGGKLRILKGEKVDNFDYKLSDGLDIYTVRGEFHYQDTTFSLLFGGRGVLGEWGTFRLFADAYLGATYTTTKLMITASSEGINNSQSYDLEGTSVPVASIGLGGEYRLSAEASFFTSASYEMSAKRKVKMKEDESNESSDEESEKSDLNFSNLALNVGFNFYF